MALTDKLTALGDAIREKNGTTDPMTLDEMAMAIDAIEGSSVDRYVPTDEDLTIKEGYLRFAGRGWTDFIEWYKDKITTKNLLGVQQMFYLSNLKSVPFEINCTTDRAMTCEGMFDGSSFETLPVVNYCRPNSLENMFNSCYYLKEVPDKFFDGFNWDTINSSTTSNIFAYLYGDCRSLRQASLVPFANANPNTNYNRAYWYSSLFSGTYVLDELIDLPIPYVSTWTKNSFGNDWLKNCYRLANLTFETPNNQPVVVKWKNQVIDLSSGQHIGRLHYASDRSYITKYNTGITADKEVSDATSYEKLKNDPDWFSSNIYYSRYNHDSAVRTINSLPDASAYLAEVGGTNTIKFYGVSGRDTDGGAINTLTEEEIAVAITKGWTVSLT